MVSHLERGLAMALKLHKKYYKKQKIFIKIYKKIQIDDIIIHVHTNMEGEI